MVLKLLLLMLCFINEVACSSICLDPLEIIHYDNILLDRRCLWFDQVNEFKKSNEQADIVMIGDSITEHGNWEKISNSSRIINRGLGGDTTALVLERMDSIFSINASTAYIMLGINDLYRINNIDLIYLNYSKIINQLLSKNINVIILSTLQCNSSLETSRCPDIHNNIKSLNLKLSKTENSTFIDLNKELSDSNGLKLQYTSDGIHLNSSGYSIIYNLINQ